MDPRANEFMYTINPLFAKAYELANVETYKFKFESLILKYSFGLNYGKNVKVVDRIVKTKAFLNLINFIQNRNKFQNIKDNRIDSRVKPTREHRSYYDHRSYPSVDRTKLLYTLLKIKFERKNKYFVYSLVNWDKISFVLQQLFSKIDENRYTTVKPIVDRIRFEYTTVKPIVNILKFGITSVKNLPTEVSKTINYYLYKNEVQKDLTGFIENILNNLVSMNYLELTNNNLLMQSLEIDYKNVSMTDTIYKILYFKENVSLHDDYNNYKYFQYIYPLIALSNSAVENYKQRIPIYSKNLYQLNNEKYHYIKLIPELNNGELWDNEIDTIYGAFETVADAFEAAKKYQEYRPFIINDTDFWTYRVIIDSNLVCPMRVRYPIAWLIRGG